MGYIYKITNNINSKIYIGQTVNLIEDRWQAHIDDAFHGNKDNSILHAAILKYGISNFTVEKIEEIPNEELNEREKYYIALFSSYYKFEKGYNLTYGGEGTTRYSDEEILELWNAGLRAGEIAEKTGANPNTISQRLKTLVEKSEVRKRYFNSRKKAVIQYTIYGDLVRIWDSAHDAEVALEISSGAISKCCNQISSIAGGFLWKFVDSDITLEEIQNKYALSNKCMDVNLINDEGKILAWYPSAKAAELDLDLPRGKVSEVCNGKRKHTKKYKFEWGYPIKRRNIYDRINGSTEKNS